MTSLYSKALYDEMRQESIVAKEKAVQFLIKVSLSSMDIIDPVVADRVRNSPDSLERLKQEFLDDLRRAG